jgi:diguanylate cyclase (GGDEF)-like protein
VLQFPDPERLRKPAPSAYEAELERGRVTLRFPPQLEREFRKVHLDRVSSRVRAWQVALLVIVGLSSVYRLGLLGGLGPNLETALRLGVLLPACLSMLFAAWSSKFASRYLRTAFFGSMVVSVVSSALVAQVVAEGGESSLAFLTTNAFATFFLAGLLFYDALLVAALGVLTFLVAGSYHGLPADQLVYDGLLIALVAAVGTFIAFGVEESNRRFFLERGRLGDLAERDGLTGLRNRRAFDEHLLRVWQQSLRDRSSLAVLLIDIDHFKRYNDTYGHQAGDACLRHIAQIVQQFSRRPLDVAARYGGEELAIVLYRVTSEHAAMVAEQLRASVEAARLEHREAPTRGQVTVSVGVAWLDATLDRAPEEAVKFADQALYAAKLAGRNAVRVVGRDEPAVFTSHLRVVPLARPAAKP